MNLSKNAKKRLVTVGALVAPVLMVQTVRWVFNAPSGPSGASAAMPTDADPVIPPTTTPKLSKEQQAANAWARGVQIAMDLHSPMDHGEPKAAVETAAPTPTNPTPRQPEVDPVATIASKLAVGAIFGGRGGQMATINGRVFGVGEEPAPGWRIEKIDLRSGVVTLNGPSDKTVELRVQPRDNK